MGSLDRMRLIGRDDESAQLYDAMMLASQGQPQLVLVLGDAGIGKTTLVNDLLARADELGFAAATGHCLDIEAAMSFAPLSRRCASCSPGTTTWAQAPSPTDDRRCSTRAPPSPIRSGCSTT